MNADDWREQGPMKFPLNPTLIINDKGEEKRIHGTPDPSFTDKKIVPSTYEPFLEQMIATQKMRRTYDPSQNEANISIETAFPWIAVFETGDWHIGSERTDYVLWSKHMNIVRETDGLFMTIIGDERDNFIFPKFMNGTHEHVLPPQQQAEFIEWYLKMFDDTGKLLARVGGNHDGWTWAMAGLHLEQFWYREMKSPLLENGGFLHLDVNGVPYEFYLHHGITIFNSNFNPNHAVKRAFEFQGPFDVGAMGHSHVAEVAHSYRWADSHQKDYVQLRTGTYKLDDQYARSRQLGRGQEAGSTVLLNTKERRMMPFLKLEDAVMVLNSLNGGV